MTRSDNGKNICVSWLVGMLVIAGSALGDEPADISETLSGTKWDIRVGAFYPRVDTRLRVDGALGLLGTELDLETLGLDKNEPLPALGVSWQANAKHSLWGSYFELNRRGFTNTDIEIRVGETVFPVSTDISAYFRADVLALGYGYSFVNTKDKRLGLRIGLSVQDAAIGIESLEGQVKENADAIAPLPTFGFIAGMRLADRWYLSSELGYFAAKIDEYDGSIKQLSVTIERGFADNWTANLSYSYLNVDVESEGVRWLGYFRYEYYGPSLSVGYKF